MVLVSPDLDPNHLMSDSVPERIFEKKKLKIFQQKYEKFS